VPVAADAEVYLSSALVDRFDVIGWDPRGVAESTAVDCLDDLDPFFAVDRSPDDAAEVQENVAAAQDFASACRERSGDLLPFLSSGATVDDMDAIRSALGEEQITYLGFSYGTSLGARYADTYPDRVRAMTLDGAVDPSLTSEELTRQQALGFEAALTAFLDSCERDGCGFGGSDPHDAYEQLMSQIDAESLPAELAGEERLLGSGEADIGVATALYAGRAGWDILGAALTDAATGDGAALLRLSDIYTGRSPGGEYDNSQEAFYAIGCVDAPAPPIDQLPALAASIADAAPNFGAATTWLGAPCSVWPVPPEGVPGPIVAADAPPIVVVGTTNDPATPLAWAQALAQQLTSATLLVHQGEGHTAYGSGNVCIDDAVDAYLVELQLPAPGTVC
jgi:pimeloyl-ACP methyl ester carboxylesterase